MFENLSNVTSFNPNLVELYFTISQGKGPACFWNELQTLPVHINTLCRNLFEIDLNILA